MSDPQVSLQYEPTKQDRIMGRPNANGFRGLSPFLAVMPPSSYLVHGNAALGAGPGRTKASVPTQARLVAWGHAAVFFQPL
jgi:hypothetical protein